MPALGSVLVPPQRTTLQPCNACHGRVFSRCQCLEIDKRRFEALAAVVSGNNRRVPAEAAATVSKGLAPTRHVASVSPRSLDADERCTGVVAGLGVGVRVEPAGRLCSGSEPEVKGRKTRGRKTAVDEYDDKHKGEGSFAR